MCYCLPIFQRQIALFTLSLLSSVACSHVLSLNNDNDTHTKTKTKKGDKFQEIGVTRLNQMGPVRVLHYVFYYFSDALASLALIIVTDLPKLEIRNF